MGVAQSAKGRQEATLGGQPLDRWTQQESRCGAEGASLPQGGAGVQMLVTLSCGHVTAAASGGRPETPHAKNFHSLPEG